MATPGYYRWLKQIGYYNYATKGKYNDKISTIDSMLGTGIRIQDKVNAFNSGWSEGQEQLEKPHMQEIIDEKNKAFIEGTLKGYTMKPQAIMTKNKDILSFSNLKNVTLDVENVTPLFGEPRILTDIEKREIRKGLKPFIKRDIEKTSPSLAPNEIIQEYEKRINLLKNGPRKYLYEELNKARAGNTALITPTFSLYNKKLINLNTGDINKAIYYNPKSKDIEEITNKQFEDIVSFPGETPLLSSAKSKLEKRKSIAIRGQQKEKFTSFEEDLPKQPIRRSTSGGTLKIITPYGKQKIKISPLSSNINTKISHSVTSPINQVKNQKDTTKPIEISALNIQTNQPQEPVQKGDLISLSDIGPPPLPPPSIEKNKKGYEYIMDEFKNPQFTDLIKNKYSSFINDIDKKYKMTLDDAYIKYIDLSKRSNIIKKYIEPHLFDNVNLGINNYFENENINYDTFYKSLNKTEQKELDKYTNEEAKRIYNASNTEIKKMLINDQPNKDMPISDKDIKATKIAASEHLTSSIQEYLTSILKQNNINLEPRIKQKRLKANKKAKKMITRTISQQRAFNIDQSDKLIKHNKSGIVGDDLYIRGIKQNEENYDKFNNYLNDGNIDIKQLTSDEIDKNWTDYEASLKNINIDIDAEINKTIKNKSTKIINGEFYYKGVLQDNAAYKQFIDYITNKRNPPISLKTWYTTSMKQKNNYWAKFCLDNNITVKK